MSKLMKIFIWTVLSMAFLLMLLFTYWYTYPYKVAEFKNLPFPVINSVVKGGERLRYVVEYCKYTDQMPEVTKFFIDGVVYETPKTVGVVKKGCGTVISDVYVPKSIPAGRYEIKIVATYKVNPIRTIRVVNYTEFFEIR